MNKRTKDSYYMSSARVLINPSSCFGYLGITVNTECAGKGGPQTASSFGVELC